MNRDQNEHEDQNDNEQENRDFSDQETEQEDTNASDNSKDTQPVITGEQHKDFVKKFTESLMTVGNQDKKIGDQVREIASAQHENDDDVAQALDEVQNRGKFKTFLFGSDYKNIGKIRSESAQTAQRITQLEKIAADTTDQSTKDALTQQVQSIKDEQQKLDTFVTEHEHVFSLFGWFTKLFAK
jgi:hypothetical protein